MDNEIVQPELDMPQLRQMVLENTKRIDRNELMINIMRKKTVEQTRKISERDEWLENYRRENDRSMRESKERMDRLEKFAETSKIEQERLSREIKEQMKESRENFDREMKESRAEFDRRMKESDEKFDREMKESREAFDKRMKECDEKNEKQNKEIREMFAETNREVKEMFAETREMFAETNASIRRMSVEFIGVTGHIVEGLVSSSTEKIFRDAGFDLHNSGKNLKRELASENRQMEIDVMLGNDKIVVPVEVKANFTKRKVKRWLQKMETFRDFFPECADKEVIAAVAAINYEAGADTLAHDEGLLVIRVSSDDIFSLDPVDEEKLRRF